MSDEQFLARWSRRKREAKTADDAPPPAQPAETPKPAPAATAETPAADELDLSSLPPIDSITAPTDITAFLRKGIPPELRRAALRRAWAADPAIRDFVGLAENAWDFNDPNAMPGFGPLDCSAEQLSALDRPDRRKRAQRRRQRHDRGRGSATGFQPVDSERASRACRMRPGTPPEPPAPQRASKDEPPALLLQCNRILRRARRMRWCWFGGAHTAAHCRASLSTKGYSHRLSRFQLTRLGSRV